MSLRSKVGASVERLAHRAGYRLHIEPLNPPPAAPLGMRDVRVPAVDLVLHLDMDEGLDRSYAENVVDESCLAFLRDHMRMGGAFVDIGANQGLYTCVVLHEFPDVTVVSVEPDPYSVAKLTRNVELNDLDAGRLRLFECAAGAEDGTLDLMLNVAGNRAGSSLVVDQRQWTHRAENVTIPVTVRPLLDLLREAEVDRVAVLKIDIEGYEYPVLEAFFASAPPEVLPTAIIAEAFGHTIPLVGGSTVELCVRAGYHLVDHETCNFLFVRG